MVGPGEQFQCSEEDGYYLLGRGLVEIVHPPTVKMPAPENKAVKPPENKKAKSPVRTPEPKGSVQKPKPKRQVTRRKKK